MRAICEACGHKQPSDWKPGDLCGHCGAVVRREKRCHWCVQLTPDGKFCRHCGAGQVPDAQFGAARWLKHLGTDQFVLPDRLAALDPGQLEHFTRLYQRHALVAERHLDDLAFAESFARQRGWTRTLEADLLPRLPLPDAALQELYLPARHGITDLEQLLEIREATPFALTRQLAALARLRHWQAGAEAFSLEFSNDLEVALQALAAPDDLPLREEAALTLCHWRFVLMSGLAAQSTIRQVLLAARACPLEAAVSLALLQAHSQSTAQPVPAAALASENPDVAFAAALASHTPAPLLAALRVPARGFAAAYTLTVMRLDFALAPLLPGFSPDQLDDLLRILAWQKHPRPDLRLFLSAAAAGQYGVAPHVRQKARELLLLDLRPDEAALLVRAQPDSSFITKILQAPTLPPSEVADVCRELVALNLFYPSQLSVLTDLINRNALPLGFVPGLWRTAPPTSLYGLATLARRQLVTHTTPEVQPLHAFLREVVWDYDDDDGGAPRETRRQARSVLDDWYRGAADRPALAFGPAAALYFPSFKAFIEDYLYGLEHPAALHDLSAGYEFLRLLETFGEAPDASVLLAALAALPPALLLRLRAALVALAHDESREWNPRKWAILALSQLQHHAPWRQAVRADLTSLLGTSLDFMVEEALEK